MDLEEFNKVFPKLLTLLTTEGWEQDSRLATDWFKKVFEYNVPFGKKTRGMTVVKTFQYFASKESATEENVQLAAILGWCVELFQAHFLVTDDVIDHSETRRGKRCWYKNEMVGFQAINDAVYIENAIYIVLKRYFRNKDYYVDLFELFVTMMKQTLTGQTLDGIFSVVDGKINLDHYTKERVNAIVKYKTSYYTFFLPVALGMYMAGYTEAKIEKTKPLLLALGQLFQAQDDYIDCYGDPEITGKIGTDIEDGKCCWMVATALERASECQKQILTENYGKANTKHVAKVKALYDELDLKSVYKEYEENQYKEITTMIEELAKDMPATIFKELLNGIYKRVK